MQPCPRTHPEKDKPLRSSHPLWLRRVSLVSAISFAWSFGLATPLQALTHQPVKPHAQPRALSLQEMKQIRGAQIASKPCVVGGGSAYPWQAQVGDVNVGNGNKETAHPIVAWTARGGLPVNLTLYHNSQATYNAELGNKWRHSYNITLASSAPIVAQAITSGGGMDAAAGTSNNTMSVTWGDCQTYSFTQNVDGSYSPPTGIHETLVANADGTYTLTKANQVKYHFNTGLYCDSITDENGNAITLGFTSSQVTSITDPTGRAITLGYTSGRITSITDPLSRQWTLAYNASGDLTTVSNPALSGTVYSTTYTYTNHNITDIQTPRGYHRTYNYNSDNSVAWEKDPALNQTSYAYTSTTSTVTDPNGNATVYTYDGSARLTQVKDPLLYHEDYVYDTSNNKTQVTDKRGYVTSATYDANGNVLTTTNPYLKVVTNTYNSHNKLLTTTLPTGESVADTYDTHDNLTQTDQKGSTGTIQASTIYTPNTYGLVTAKTDANGHATGYGYDANGNLTSVTTPLGKVTSWVYDALGFRTSRTDAMSRTTTYTPDTWERPVTITYPDTTTKTFQYDADSNVTQFVDVTGTTTRTYDSCDRLLTESKGGSTVVTYAYDGVGKKGLLASVTDSGSRAITYSYTTRNQLSSVSEVAGTTSYSYDAAGNETGITNRNSTTVAKVYDNAGRLTSLSNKNSGNTVLSSFVYAYDDDNRKHTVTEADGSVVTYGYDWGSRLTSEVRTGTSAYSAGYIVDNVGNRTSQTVGSTTTTFSLDNDDQLNSTSGGFVNSYSYNANGEQTGRTLSGTAYTLAYDYDGQLASITNGGAVTSFTYDAGGRRASRTSGGTTTSFQYAGSQILLEKQGTTTTATYTYGNALVRKDSETPLFDGLGSERTVTDNSQNVQGTATYEGFGQTIATTGSSTNPYMFAATSGYRNDGDAGLCHVGARYYDAQVGRFITRDTYLAQKPYLYCEHDPINAVDPSGHDIWGCFGDVWKYLNDPLNYWDWPKVREDAKDIGAAAGAIVGIILGGFVGLPSGPPGVITGGGAGGIIGGAAGGIGARHFIDAISDPQVRHDWPSGNAPGIHP